MTSQALGRRFPRHWLVATLLFMLATTMTLAGCGASGSSSGANFQLGLQGSTAEYPAPPPKIAATGPASDYAFVYDNQVWAHLKGAKTAIQITHLLLSNGATLVWGPLMWSPSGNSLAFSLVQNLSTNQPTRTAGSIYYVSLANCLNSSGVQCPIYNTQATGSVYGHSYAWFGDDWIISGSGGGLSAYDVSDPNGSRTWQVRTTSTEAQDSACGEPRSYGDVQVVGSTLYYTCMDLSNLGASAPGSASLNSLSLVTVTTALAADPTTRDEQIATILNSGALVGTPVASLGNVYLDAQGNTVAGAWQVGATSLAFEQVGAEDAQRGVVARTVCGAAVASPATCAATPLPAVTSQTLAAHPQISLGPNGAIAYQGDKLFLSGQDGALSVTSPYAPGWLPSGAVAATNVVSTSADASGVIRVTANLVIAQTGTPTTLIAGASDIALQ